MVTTFDDIIERHSYFKSQWNDRAQFELIAKRLFTDVGSATDAESEADRWKRDRGWTSGRGHLPLQLSSNQQQLPVVVVQPMTNTAQTRRMQTRRHSLHIVPTKTRSVARSARHSVHCVFRPQVLHSRFILDSPSAWDENQYRDYCFDKVDKKKSKMLYNLYCRYKRIVIAPENG